MKKPIMPILSACALAFLMVSLSGCDLFDKVGDVTFDADLPLEFVISETDFSSDPVEYTDTKNLDATDNADVEKYKDKIKDFKVNSITYEITNFSAPGSVTFSNGKLKVLSTGTTIASVSSVDLGSSSGEVEMTDVNLDGFNDLAQKLKADKAVDVVTQGTFSSTPVAFTLTVYFHVTITANPL